jgi:hypothetical protein
LYNKKLFSTAKILYVTKQNLLAKKELANVKVFIKKSKIQEVL